MVLETSITVAGKKLGICRTLADTHGFDRGRKMWQRHLFRDSSMRDWTLAKICFEIPVL
jgi:hypothetical protein